MSTYSLPSPKEKERKEIDARLRELEEERDEIARQLVQESKLDEDLIIPDDGDAWRNLTIGEREAHIADAKKSNEGYAKLKKDWSSNHTEAEALRKKREQLG